MRRRTARALVATGAAILCAELFGLGAFYVDTGGLFYTHSKTYEDLLPAPEDRLVLGEAVHPYFGFTHRPGAAFDIPASLRSPGAAPARLTTNNFGFVSPHDFPFGKTGDRQFLLGIFGGSVAVWFCQIGAPRLVEDLQKQPLFRDREIVPLCFSHEGYKQPQEALVLAYFLSIGQTFDLVLNIDGFNDVALGALNSTRGFEFSMPSLQHLDPLISVVNQSALTPEKLDLLAAIFRDRRRLTELAGTIGANSLASVNFVLDRYYAIVRDRYVRELGRFNGLPSNPVENAFVQMAKPTDTRERGALFTEIAAVWARASRLMHTELAERRVPYLHVLQPNQYATARRFGPEEAKVALSDASPYRKDAEEGYPALLRAAASTLVQEKWFVDATHVFDRVPAPVYMDNCCHYTRLGNEVLADFIADSIASTPGPWRP
ncbi:MAG: hypothetical protein HY824_04485 [Acidobacteria bacterium]|nr:hypothetical protein [Acidobacteriota bacterium]